MPLWGRAAELNDYEGGAHWDIDNYRRFNYLSNFAEKWLKGVCVSG